MDVQSRTTWVANLPPEVRRDAQDTVTLDSLIVQSPDGPDLDALIARRRAVADAANAFQATFGHALTPWLQYPWVR